MKNALQVIPVVFLQQTLIRKSGGTIGMKKLPATLVHLQKKAMDFAPPVILEATKSKQDKTHVLHVTLEATKIKQEKVHVKHVKMIQATLR